MHNGMLFDYCKKKNGILVFTIDGWKEDHYVKRNKPGPERHVPHDLIHLLICITVALIEVESRMDFPQVRDSRKEVGWGRDIGSVRQEQEVLGSATGVPRMLMMPWTLQKAKEERIWNTLTTDKSAMLESVDMSNVMSHLSMIQCFHVFNLPQYPIRMYNAYDFIYQNKILT